MWFKNKRGARIPSSPEELNDRELNAVVGAGFTAGSPARGKVQAVAAAGYENAPVKLEYEDFCAKFCHRAGLFLMRDYVLVEDDRRLIAWLDWQGHEPEARAFIRLMLAMLRAGESIWDQSGISMFRQGQWSTSPQPSAASQVALSVMAQLIEKPIRVLYKTTANAPDTQLLQFDP